MANTWMELDSCSGTKRLPMCLEDNEVPACTSHRINQKPRRLLMAHDINYKMRVSGLLRSPRRADLNGSRSCVENCVSFCLFLCFLLLPPSYSWTCNGLRANMLTCPLLLPLKEPFAFSVKTSSQPPFAQLAGHMGRQTRP